MRKQLLYLFILISVSINAQTSFEKGERFFEAEKWNSAKKEFQQVSTSSRQFAKSQEYLGDIAAHQKKWDML